MQVLKTQQGLNKLSPNRTRLADYALFAKTSLTLYEVQKLLLLDRGKLTIMFTNNETLHITNAIHLGNMTSPLKIKPECFVNSTVCLQHLQATFHNNIQK